MTTIARDIQTFREVLPEHTEQLLQNLGKGMSLSAPYDTAWLAQLHRCYPQHGFEKAQTWIESHQHDDGSWGASTPHFHDRIICTLAALVALSTGERNASTDYRINKAVNYVKANVHHISRDANDTINFIGIATSLLGTTRWLGLDTPSPEIYPISPKLARLKNRPDLWSNHSIAYSLECFQPTFENAQHIILSDGSIAASPAATISVLLNSDIPIPKAMDYVQRYIRDDGGIPTVAPINLFETTWSLYHLLTADAITPAHPDVQRMLRFDWQYWNPIRGQSSFTNFILENLDDSSSAFLILRWGGYPVDISTFAWYEQDDHFFCFQEEANPSLHAHIRLLLALKTESLDHPWIGKIAAFIAKYHKSPAPFDKWHISPYYVHASSVPALHRINDALVHSYVHYILTHQNTDGGWGYYGKSTSEETAYALKALIYYHKNIQRVEQSTLDKAAHFLIDNYNKPYPAAWIGKCLYTPYQVITAAILGALHAYVQLQ